MLSVSPINNRTVLQADQLNVYRSKRHILKGVGFDLREGEVLGLIGANGSGKSTLLKSMLGFLPVESGTISIIEKPIEQYKSNELARIIGYMAQENECRWPLAVAQLVALGRMPYQSPWQTMSNEDWEIVRKSMETVGIEHLAERTVTRLSGGERHRVLFARALASEPKILFADEPTAGLDPYHQLHLMELLRAQAQSGKSVIVVLHDLTHAARFCDRLVLLKQGEVLASGNSMEVLNTANLKSAYAIEATPFSNGETQTIIPWNCCS